MFGGRYRRVAEVQAVKNLKVDGERWGRVAETEGFPTWAQQFSGPSVVKPFTLIEAYLWGP